MLVALQGNLGSGKSTILRQLQLEGYTVVPEPVHIWDTYIHNGQSLLQLFYADPARYGFTLQIMIMLNFVKSIENACATAKGIVILERSPVASYKIFVTRLVEAGFMSQVELTLYQELFHALIPHYNIVNIYLRTDPTIAHRRVQLRNRLGEESVSLDYLHALHRLHEIWLADNVYVINANEPVQLTYSNILRFLRTMND